MKKAFLVILAFIFILTGCSAGGSSSSSLNDEKRFCELVSESQALLDDVADTIYSNWYDAIYNKKFSSNINKAIASALSTHSSDIKTIKSNDTEIKSLYQNIRDGKCSDEVKEVMQSYNDYYELVINVSGSFNTYKTNKESLKKALASAIRNLEMEI